MMMMMTLLAVCSNSPGHERARMGLGLFFGAAITVLAVWMAIRLDPEDTQDPNVELLLSSGAELAPIRCAVCHLLPGPDVLPTSGWVNLFARKLSIVDEYLNATNRDLRGLVDADEMEAIAEYYRSASVNQEALVGPPAPLGTPVPWLEYVADERVDPELPQQGYVDVFVDNDARRLVFTDFFRSSLRLYDFSGAPVGVVPVGDTPTRIERDGTTLLVSLMEAPQGGAVVEVDLDYDNPSSSVVRGVAGDLERPIRAYPTTLFGARGAIIEEFASHKRGLAFWHRVEEEQLGTPDVLLDAWGVVESAVADLDQDGDLDLVVLISQEREQLLLFEGVNGDLRSPRVVFQGHPGFGFNGLTLTDVDGDGLTDIVTTNGDNYDDAHGSPLKPYHGIRVYRNAGVLTFEAPIVLAMHGVIDVLSADFDIDGDLDLLAVSAFPDPRIRPYESVVLFEQIRPLEFAPLAIAEAGGSRWVAAAGVDMEGDGDLDIVLAGANTSTTRADRRWSALAGPDPRIMVLLRNKTIDADGSH